MKRTILSISILAAVGVIGLSACGGGGSSGSGASAGAGSKTTTGVITGFGSVFVNGVEYRSTTASVSANGAASSESNLSIGQVVTVTGSVDANGTTGTATTISYRNELEGVVLANNVAAGSRTGTMDIMGQTVQVVASTVFQSNVAAVTSLDQITPKSYVVEVSGNSDGTGNIVATRIEVKKAYTPGDTIEVKGVVAALDTVAKTFTLGGLTIDYSAATNVAGNLANGLYVQAISTSLPTGTTLKATQVVQEDDGVFGLQGTSGSTLEIRGVLDAVDSKANTITINGQVVKVTADVVAALSGSVGKTVKIEGVVQADGTLLVNGSANAQMEREGDTEVAATVDSVDTIAKTITALGKTVQVTTTTMMHDERHNTAAVRYFSVADIAAGDRIEVQFYADANGKLIATEVKRVDANTANATKFQFQSKVTAVGANSVSAGGFTFDTTGLVVPAFVVGQEIQVVGTYSGGVFTLTSIK